MTKEELKQEAEVYASKGGLPKETYLFGAKVIAYLAGAEPREKQLQEKDKKIAELEAEVKEWKDKAGLWCKTANLKDHNILRTKELEKENAELKKLKRECETSLCRAEYQYNYEQLTKAKNLLQNVADVCGYPNYDVPVKLYTDIEQFLKE